LNRIPLPEAALSTSVFDVHSTPGATGGSPTSVFDVHSVQTHWQTSCQWRPASFRRKNAEKDELGIVAPIPPARAAPLT